MIHIEFHDLRSCFCPSLIFYFELIFRFNLVVFREDLRCTRISRCRPICKMCSCDVMRNTFEFSFFFNSFSAIFFYLINFFFNWTLLTVRGMPLNSQHSTPSQSYRPLCCFFSICFDRKMSSSTEHDVSKNKGEKKIRFSVETWDFRVSELFGYKPIQCCMLIKGPTWATGVLLNSCKHSYNFFFLRLNVTVSHLTDWEKSKWRKKKWQKP